MIDTKLGKFHKIVIYQYGKVGSSSIGTNICKWLNCKFPGTTMKVQPRYPKVVHIHNPAILQDILKKYDQVLIINATRNFYHRQISEYFQQSKNKEKIKTYTLSQLADSLLDNSIYRLNDWYARFEKLLGFTLQSFDYQKHYSLTRYSKNKKNIDVLIVRLEDSKHWEKVFREVVHPKIKFGIKSNLSKNCWYGDTYNKFKNYFIYPQEAVERLEQSDTHIRFYADLKQLKLTLPVE